MKKYVKPDLYFESFQLTQHIAACGYDYMGTLEEAKNCTFVGDEDMGNVPGIYFLDSKYGCETVVDRYCYTNGTDNEQIRIYNS